MTPLVLFALFSTAASVLGSSYPIEVVKLTDANFEHDTQAASGQTTGVWAVLFTDSTLKRHERATLVLEELAQDEEKELIYAQVDVAQNVKLARRFGDHIFPPCILLFRSRQMYLFDMSFEREDIVQQIRDFVTSGFALADPLDVPEHRDRQLDIASLQASTEMDYKTVGIAVLMIVGGLLFQTWAIMNKHKFKPEPGTPEAAAAAAAAAVTSLATEGKQATENKPSAAAAAAIASPSDGKRGSSKGAKKGKAS